MTLDGRLALVTGGSRGIGRTISVDLARRGADVAFTYLRNEEAAQETTAQIEAEGRRGFAIRSRIDSAERCAALVDEAAASLGGLDVLVSNAASGVIRPALEVTEKHWDWTLNTNARAIVFLAQAAVPHMEARGGGAIIGMSSLGSFRVLENYTLVGVSKAALEAAIRYLAVELAPRGIRVNGVSGAVVETGALDALPEPRRHAPRRCGEDAGGPDPGSAGPRECRRLAGGHGVVDGDRPDTDRRRRLLAAGVVRTAAAAGPLRRDGRPRRAPPATRRGASPARAARA